MSTWSLALAVALVLPASVLAPGGSSVAEPAPQIVDPRGDAYEPGTQWATSSALGICTLHTTLGTPCVRALRDSGIFTALPEAGVPADPTLDVLALTIQETPDDLVIDLGLAAVEEDFAGAEPDEAGVAYVVCWGLDPCGAPVEQGWEIALVFVFRVQGGLQVIPVFARFHADCGSWATCAWKVPFEVLPGSPGSLRWTIPRVLLADGDRGASLPALAIGSIRLDHVTDPVNVCLCNLPLAFSTTLGNDVLLVVDSAFTDEVYALSSPASGARPPSVPRLEDWAGDVVGGQRPDLDLLGFEILERPDALTVAFQVAEVAAEPTSTSLFFTFALAGTMYHGGVAGSEGTRSAWSGYCPEPACGTWVSLRPGLEVAPGSPGWLNVTLEREPMGSPPAGLPYTLGFAAMTDGQQPPLPAEAGPYLTPGGNTHWDLAGWMPPAWLAAPTVPREATGPPLLEDDLDDVQFPGAGAPPVRRADEARYDVLFLEAAPEPPGDLRLTLGVQDLSRVDVPTGYEAVVYAAGVETERGRFMAGYLKDNRDQQEFFCAQDTAVLTEEKRDPTKVIREAIRGVVSVSGSSQGSRLGGASPTTAAADTITFYVPLACLGEAAEQTLRIQRLGAGSYLIENPAGFVPVTSRPEGTVHALDEVAGDEVALLQFAAGPAPEPPWYVAPFGVANFWDMAGLLAAAAAAGFGLLLVRRRQANLRRYLAEVDAAAARHADRPRELDAALQGVRARLKEDLARGRLEQGHYLAIESRIGEKLSRARVRLLAEAFDDLPHGLLQKLQDLLADGQLSPDDYRVFSALLENTGLTREAKARVRRKLQVWVAEPRAAPA